MTSLSYIAYFFNMTSLSYIEVQ